MQAESSKFASLLFDQGVQIVINPSSVVYVPERSERHLTIFCIDPIVVYYVNTSGLKFEREANNTLANWKFEPGK